MLHELKNARQIPGEGFRRWFTDEDMDLVVWYHDDSVREILGFQLSFDKRSSQHALTWTARQGFQLSRIDDGEVPFANKMSPVLVPAAGFDGGRVQNLFVAAASGLEYGLVTLVGQRIGEFDRLYHQGGGGASGHARQLPLAGQVLLDALRDAFFGPGLHGPSLLSSLRLISAELAVRLWPAHGTGKAAHGDEGEGERFSPWQIALHCAYWKRSVTRQLEAHLGRPMEQSAHRFELADWVATPPAAGTAEWTECLDGLCQEHEALVAACQELVRDPDKLNLIEAGSGFSWAQYVYGMAAHDVYHTAQLRNLGIPGLAKA